MHSVSLLLLCIAAASELAVSAVPRKSPGKGIEPVIINGHDAEKGEFPHQVLLKRGHHPNIHGGSIIAENWILTTASNVQHVPDDITIVAGKLKLDENDGNEQERKIVEVIIHPLENPGGWDPNDAYNTALVRVDKPFEFNDYVQPIALLPAGEEVPLGRGLITGWGKTEYTDEAEYTNTLQKLNVTIYDVKVCQDAYGTVGYDFRDNVLCATGSLDGGADICLGDFGGPLLTLEKEQLYQVGYLLFTMTPCGEPGFPSGYVSVAENLDFIREHVPELK